MKKFISTLLLLLVSSIGLIRAEAPPDTAWVRVFNRDGSSGSLGHGCVVDTLRSTTYITGYSSQVSTKSDVLILSLNSSNGQFYDTIAYDDTLHLYEWGYSSDLDIPGNFLYTSGSAVLNDSTWLFIKYDLNTGSLLWSKNYAVENSGTSFAWKARLSNDKNYFYTAGFTNSQVVDGILFKIDAQTGDSLWAKRYACGFDSIDSFFGLSLGQDDSIVYVCGSTSNGFYPVGLVQAYGADGGDSLWSRTYDYGTPFVVFYDCAIDAARNRLLIAGQEGQRGKLLAIDLTDQDTAWSSTCPGPETTYFYCCHLDTSGDYLYAAGVDQSAHDSMQCLVVKCNAATGDTVWSMRILLPNFQYTEIFSCDVDQNNDLYLGGRAYDGSAYKMIAIKLNTGVTGVGGKPGDENFPLSLKLGQCVPNPFELKTAISYQTRESRRVELKIYNLAGQLVRTLVDAPQSAGSHVAEWDGRDQKGGKAKNGVYIVKISSGESIKYGKVLLIR